MKKLLFLGAIGAFLYADILINFDELPQNIQDFVKTHYANANVLKAEKDWDSYEIKLSNGTEIDFNKNGELKEIDAKLEPIPASVMPELTKAAIDSQNGAKLKKLEKKYNGYKLKFSNHFKVYIDDKGTIIKTIFDD